MPVLDLVLECEVCSDAKVAIVARVGAKRWASTLQTILSPAQGASIGVASVLFAMSLPFEPE
jgi:hypothetical protein